MLNYEQQLLRKKQKEQYNAENKVIEHYENEALTNYQIENILQGRTKILTYKQLPQFDNIHDILEPFENFIMLYLARPNYGHWICVLQHPDRIEFFDPYGGEDNIPDTVLDNINEDVKEITNQDYPYLSQLLDDSGYPIEYNNYKFQKHAKDIKTCGRHCIVRVFFKDLLLDDYYEFMTLLANKMKMNYDQLVTFLTAPLESYTH